MMENWQKLDIKIWWDEKTGKKKLCPMQSNWAEAPTRSTQPTSYGIKTGKVNNITVLDFDVKPGERSGIDFIKKYRDLITNTFVVRTQSGGYHAYFKYCDLKQSQQAYRAGNQILGLDIRNDGGFVIGPGTQFKDGDGLIREYKIHKNNPVLEMPKQLYELLKGQFDEDLNPISKIEKPIPEQEKPIEKLLGIKTIEVKKDGSNQLIEKLELLPDSFWNPYNTWYRAGMAIFNLSNDIEIWDRFSHKSSFYDRIEIEQKWKSFKEDQIEKLGWGWINEQLNLHVVDKQKVKEVLAKYGTRDIIFNDGVINIAEAMKDWRQVLLAPKEKKSEEKSKFYTKYMAYYLVCYEGGSGMVYFREKNIDSVFWTKCSLASIKKDYPFFNNLYCTTINFTTVSTEPFLLKEIDGYMYLNLYISPEYNLDRLLQFKTDEKIKEEVFSWVKEHFFNCICNGNEEDYLFLCRFIAGCLFDLNFWPEICPIIRSEVTGSGKTAPIEKIFKNYMGPAWCLKGDNRFDGLGSLTELAGKTFCLLDELKIENKKDYNVFKQLITSKTINIRNVYENSKTYANNCKFIATANSIRPITCKELNERRVKEFNLTNPKIYEKGYFDILIDRPWQYFTLFFVQFKDFQDFNRYYRNYNTETNQANSKIVMQQESRFIINYILAEYFSFRTKEQKYYAVLSELKNKWIEMGFFTDNKNTLSKLLQTKLINFNVIHKGEPVRKRFDDGQKPVCELKPYEEIVQYMKNVNGVDIFQGWLFCHCGNKAIYEKEDKYYCSQHKIDQTCEEIEY